MLRAEGPAAALAGLPVDEVADEVSSAISGQLGHRHAVVDEVVRQHLSTLAAAAELDVLELLGDQVAWERVRLREVNELDVQRLHDAVCGVVGARLGADGAAYVADLLARARASEVARERPEPTGLVGPGAVYLAAGLAGRRSEAVAVVRDLLAAGTSPYDVVVEVLIPAQVEVGRLWEAGRATIPEEHRLTAITASCLSLLSARGTREPPPGAPRLVATTVDVEGHDLGLRVLTDVMAGGGWHTEYLGGGIPTDALVDHVAGSRPDVVALSLTIATHVTAARDLIARLRERPECAELRILVGGRAVALKPGLVETIGADGWAANAAEALRLCDSWAGHVTDPAAPVDPQAQDHELADRYGFEPRHMSHALALLAEESGTTVEQLRYRLNDLPEV